MSIARALKRMWIPGRNQRGFSIAEVMIAGTLLAMVSLPIMQMFGTSFGIANVTDDLNKVQVCVRHFSEVTRAIPYYVPYDAAIGNQDMDDFYWGNRNPLTANEWDTAPEIAAKGYGTNPYPQFRVAIKMAYLQDDLNLAPMKLNWGPRKAGYDKPVDTVNSELHMIKYEVKAYWQLAGGGESSFETAAIVTDSQSEANLLVSSCDNVSALDAKHGSGYSAYDPVTKEGDNTAPHTEGAIDLRIRGKGFVSGHTTIKLAMDKDTDLTVSNFVFVNTGELTCTVNLSTGGKAGLPWSPKRMPGGWAVMVFVDKTFAVLMDGLIVEFPIPKLSLVAPVEGGDLESNKTISVQGAPILWLDANCHAILRLVKKNNDGSPDTTKTINAILNSTDVVTKGNTASYTAAPNTISARFDLTGKELGEYYLYVMNCKNYGNPGQLGDVTGSSQNASGGPFVFKITKTPPSVTDLYVTGSPTTKDGYNDTTYNLTVKGNYFDTSAEPGHGVTVYVGPKTTVPPAATGAKGSPASGVVVFPVDSSTITANFNMNDLSGYVGLCWVWVQNNDSGLSGSKLDVFTLHAPFSPPGTTKIENIDPDTRMAGTFKYNYYDIKVRLTGTDFLAGYKVYYKSRTGGTLYEPSALDPDPPTLESSTSYTCDLNLITLSPGTYDIWVADPSNFGNLNPALTKASFECEYGAPILLAKDALTNPSSVSIAWIRSGSTTRRETTESTSARAWCSSYYSSRNVTVKFRLQGMGFLDAPLTTNVNIGALNKNGDFSAVVNRSGKSVELYTLAVPSLANWLSRTYFTPAWVMPQVGPSAYTLTLTNPAGSSSSAGRWETWAALP